MLKVKKANFDSLLFYGFSCNSGVYSCKFGDNFEILVNRYDSKRGLIDDGVVRIGYSIDNLNLSGDETDYIDDIANAPTMLISLMQSGIVYAS